MTPVIENTLDTYQTFLTVLSNFFIVSIHTILYERSIYPPNTFISTWRYNFPVRQNRHPKVCQWVNDTVGAIEAEMLKGTVARVAVVIYAPTTEVMERFTFDVSSFPGVPPGASLTPSDGDEDNSGDENSFDDEDSSNDVGSSEEDSSNEGDMSRELKALVVDIEEQLRATVRKLAYCGGKLGPLPNGCIHTVIVELKEKANPPIRVYPDY
jgi:mitotic spindle assembly checkpoint protein MAD2B